MSTIPLTAFAGLRLRGGCVVAKIEAVEEPLMDALGREAVVQTIITGNRLSIRLRHGLPKRELSVTLYHEILEASALASPAPPAQLLDFNEGAFERAAHRARDELGTATPETLNRMLQLQGFLGKIRS